MHSQIPAKISYEAASTIPVALAAAYVGLFNTKPHGLQLPEPLEPSQRGKLAGTPLVVLGGSGSVGQYGKKISLFYYVGTRQTNLTNVR